nr:Chain C, Peptide Y9L [Toxoplasma gondii]
YLSPIASPL